MDMPISETASAVTPTPAPAAAKNFLAKVSEEMEQMPMAFWKQLGAYFFGAAFLGFVLKRYVSYVLFASVIAAGLLWFLHFIGAAQFDFSQIRLYFGISQDVTFGQFFAEFFEWAKTNFSFLIAAVVGFIIGLQLG